LKNQDLPKRTLAQKIELETLRGEASTLKNTLLNLKTNLKHAMQN